MASSSSAVTKTSSQNEAIVLEADSQDVSADKMNPGKLCQYKTNSSDGFKKHILTHVTPENKNPIPEIDQDSWLPWVCLDCAFRAKKRHEIVLHMLKEHQHVLEEEEPLLIGRQDLKDIGFIPEYPWLIFFKCGQCYSFYVHHFIGTPSKEGYVEINRGKHSECEKTLHQLMMRAFNKPRPFFIHHIDNGMLNVVPNNCRKLVYHVDHFDNNHDHNALDNFQWLTRSANSRKHRRFIADVKAFHNRNKNNVYKFERWLEITENNESIDFDKIWHRVEQDKMQVSPKNRNLNNDYEFECVWR